MLDSNALSYIMLVVLEALTVINCIITLKLNIRLRINNCLNKNNIILIVMILILRNHL